MKPRAVTPAEEVDVYALCVGRQLEQRGERTALQWPGGSLTFSSLDGHVRARAAWLGERGVEGASCVALICADPLELALNLLALAWLRVPFLTIPRATPTPQADEWAARTGCTFMITDLREPRIIPGCALLCVTGEPSREGLDDTARRAAAGRPAPRGAGDLFTVIGGSGSTGRSKLIPVSGAQMCNRVLDTVESLGLSETDRNVALIHLEYASAQHRLLAALCAGGSVVLIEHEQRGWARMIQDSSATVISAGVVHVEALLRALKQSPAPRLPSVRILTIAGSTVSDDLRRRVAAELTSEVWVVYGSNECWYATVATPRMVGETPGTIGAPSSRSRVRVLGEDGREVSAGEVGRIVVQGASISTRYLDGSETENHALGADGFHTGDLGRLAPDGQILFCGRQDNMMIFNGVNIFPVEIEQCALAYPGVAQAVAFPMTHPIHQEVPVCAVAFSEGALLDDQGLTRHLNATLGFKAPRQLFVFRSLPMISHGKPSVREIVRLIAQRDPSWKSVAGS